MGMDDVGATTRGMERLGFHIAAGALYAAKM